MYGENDDLSHDIRNYTSRLDLRSPSGHHATNNITVLDLLDYIRETTDRDSVSTPEPLVSSGISSEGVTYLHQTGGLVRLIVVPLQDPETSAKTLRELR